MKKLVIRTTCTTVTDLVVVISDSDRKLLDDRISSCKNYDDIQKVTQDFYNKYKDNSIVESVATEDFTVDGLYHEVDYEIGDPYYKIPAL